MPRRKITDIEEIEGIINKAIVCHIGLVDGDEPYVVPVCFGYERNALYFHSALKGRKVELIKKNNKVCFEMETDVEIKRAEEACDWGIKYMSVIGVGRAYILEKEDEKSYALDLITKRYAGEALSFPKSELGKTLVMRVDIESVTGKQLV
jgi:nitroimidazol reductase NimA-like FMN-containing flavoprotein (pyridoxamine 5'-phosphate oxidase superfamily)